MRMPTRLLEAATAVFACVALTASPAAAAGNRPTVQHFTATNSFPDAILTAACGFPVVTDISVRGTARTFPHQPSGLLEVTTALNDVTFHANGNDVTFRERLTELARQSADGTMTVSLTGRVFGLDFIGRLVLDADTGTVISQSGRTVDYQRICAALAA